jgi:hypothetical protein
MMNLMDKVITLWVNQVIINYILLGYRHNDPFSLTINNHLSVQTGNRLIFWSDGMME